MSPTEKDLTEQLKFELLQVLDAKIKLPALQEVRIEIRNATKEKAHVYIFVDVEIETATYHKIRTLYDKTIESILAAINDRFGKTVPVSVDLSARLEYVIKNGDLINPRRIMFVQEYENYVWYPVNP